MITYILSTSNEALRSLIAKLGNLKLTDFDGENIIQASTFIENMLIMLGDNSTTMKDFDESVHKVFKYLTCPDIVKLVDHSVKYEVCYQTIQDSGVPGNSQRGIFN